MSQYLNVSFICINCILFCALITHSFCDNSSLKIFIYNESIIIEKNFNSNHENHFLLTNSTNLNHTIQKNSYSSSLDQVKVCHSIGDCGYNQKCCPVSDKQNVCVDSLSESGEKCKAYNNKTCTTRSDCETKFELDCRSSPPHGLRCKCNDRETFDYARAKCMEEGSGNYDPNTAMQIYKITMIFASCCLALILIIFLVCILRKSYCPPRRPMMPLDNSTIPDIFTLFPHVGNYDGGPLADGTQPPFEKPPTYDETLTLIRNEIGIPPPAYRGNYSPNSTNPSTPEMASRVMITRPILMTVSPVSEETTSSSVNSSGTDCSSESSIAGPSGHQLRGRQGIDNPAFVNV